MIQKQVPHFERLIGDVATHDDRNEEFDVVPRRGEHIGLESGHNSCWVLWIVKFTIVSVFNAKRLLDLVHFPDDISLVPVALFC